MRQVANSSRRNLLAAIKVLKKLYDVSGSPRMKYSVEVIIRQTDIAE